MINQYDNRHRRVTWALVLALAATAAPQAAAAERFIPGVTDFPTRPAYVQQDEFVPGVTDFPSRPAYVEPGWTAPPIVEETNVSVSDRFDWADAGIGATAALAAALAAVGASLGVGRTRRLRHG